MRPTIGYLIGLCFVVFTTSCLFSKRLVKVNRPNIVLILSDDAGYADFSFMSSRNFETPHIDRIANSGVKFTNAYVTGAVCAPSRAGLLTGINQAEFGNVLNFVKGVPYNIPKEKFGIPENIKLIGDYLKPYGYATGAIGKWHEGFSQPFHPNARGFGYFWGFLWGSSNYSPGLEMDVEENGAAVPSGSIEYMTDAIGQKSVSFIENNKKNPFFLYVSFNAVHTPLQSKPKDLELFMAKYREDSKKMHNAAMTRCLDENVGKILEALEKNNLLENTIVVFTNDNGGQTQSLHADNFPLRGMKGDNWEGGYRVPFALMWPEKIKNASVCKYPITTLDLLPTFLVAAGGHISAAPQLKGLDLVNAVVLQNPQALRERTHYWRFAADKGALRQGRWKLTADSTMYKLYNLDEDIGEKTSLNDEFPLVLNELSAKYQAWIRSLPPLRYQPVKGETPGSKQKRASE